MMSETRNAVLLMRDLPTAEYQKPGDLLNTEVPLWLQAQQAAATGTWHGLSSIPSDLHEAYAIATWPGSPELREIYLHSADKAITSVARFLARQEITDRCERIGGINVEAETGELTPPPPTS